VIARDDARLASADALRAVLASRPVLGLSPRPGIVPDRPDGPSMAVRVAIDKAIVHVSIQASDAASGRWVPAGKFTMPAVEGPADRLAEAIAEGVLERLVRVELIRGSHANGNNIPDRLKVVNASPMILHGLAVAGSKPEATGTPALRGLALAPRRTASITLTPKMVRRLGLRTGLHATAADLGGL
jgi:hypothetical protein